MYWLWNYSWAGETILLWNNLFKMNQEYVYNIFRILFEDKEKKSITTQLVL